jgi:protein kinase C substrate 80K-H
MIGYIRVLNRVLTEANKAREKLNDAEGSLNLAQRDLEQVRKELSDLFDPTRYGSQGEWKKLQNLCLKKDTGG